MPLCLQQLDGQEEYVGWAARGVQVLQREAAPFPQELAQVSSPEWQNLKRGQLQLR
jgi:hypothetical protein